MVTSGHRRALAAVLFATPVALLSACTPNQPPSTTPGTTPSVWTGSAGPVDSAGESGGPGAAESLTVALKTADGAQVATAKFDFGASYVTVTVETTGNGRLSPGFHGLHIHGVGKCEPNSVAPTGGAPGDFLSAGGHLQVTGHDSHPQSGDLTSLQVRGDGGGLLVTTTDAFTKADLLAGEKTAIIVHADDDNFGNIPSERYTQVNGTPGPDQTTLTTGDAGKRLACGVIGSG